MPEQFAVLAIPQLLLNLRAAAPNLSLESQHLMDNYLEMLAIGKLDFVINLDQDYPEGYSTRPINSATPRLWFRKNHPLAKKRKIELTDMCAYPVITFRMQNIPTSTMRNIESMFAEAGLHLNVIFDTSHLMIALEVLVNSDALMPAPDYLSRSSIMQDSIVSRSITHLSAFSRHQINMSLVQHKRTMNSPLHRWVADQMVNLLKPAKGAKSG